MKRIIGILLFSLLYLQGCNGTSGENGPDPFGSGGSTPVLALNISVFDESCSGAPINSIELGEAFCIQAQLTRDGLGFEGQVIDFSAGLGQLAVDSRLTDAQGVAQVLLTSDNLGAGTVTVNSDSLSANANVEFLQGQQVISQAALTLAIEQNGQGVSQFRQSEAVNVQAALVDGVGQPVAGQIVSFSSVLGTFSPQSSLTDSQGVARVQFSALSGDLGAAAMTAQAEVAGVSVTGSVNYQILADNSLPQQQVRLGHFNQNGDFVEGQMGVSVDGDPVTISAGATLGLTVSIVDENDQLIASPNSISFSSNCFVEGAASLDASVNTLNGTAQATYQDLSCAGNAGNEDLITATLVVGEQNFNLQQLVSIQAESVGSIQFVSAEPNNLTIAGTGGQNAASASTLTFAVTGTLGNPLAQQRVDFALNTEIGGLSLTNLTGLTNSQGQVSTRVLAGTVPTSVRVTASTSVGENAEIKTQSDLLTINTGLPDQNSMSISATVLNPEAFNRDGETSEINVRLADSFNNPVPDGTAVSFTTEGGSIESSCLTQNGTCSVTWTSQSPRPDDHRVTILATAIGHETLFDTNGNNLFDDEDGSAIADGLDAGFYTSNFAASGFIDHSEAWRDDNENGVKDATENVFFDFNGDGQFSAADGLFNGPQCTHSSLCGQGTASSLHVRKAMVLVMSSSDVLWYLYQGEVDDANLVYSNDESLSGVPNALQLGAGESTQLVLVMTDTAGQVLPTGTQIGTLNSSGVLQDILFTVSNSTRFADSSATGHVVLLPLETGDGSTRTVTYTVETPSAARTSVSFTITP